MQAAFPDLAVSGLRLVGTGFGSIVVETGEGVILRIGRTAAAARGHAIEAAVLPGLAPMLPVAVPVPAFFCPQTSALPFGVIGSRRLAGQPCQLHTATTDTGRDLGIFLAVLHQVDSRRFPAMPGQHDVWRDWHDLRDAAEPVLRRRLTSTENQRTSRWWDLFLSDQRMRRYQPAVRHGDLWYGNILIQPSGTITAVLDWEAVAVADPAQDLALTRYLGPSFTAAVLDAYQGHGGAYDEHIRQRIERHWELREFTGIPLAAAADDEAELSECIAKLRSGPVLTR